ncbi:MAG: hypothetical protein IJC94_00005 [Oscillospiraceae bacterium]|nr:hypothetical protein [Oscillospiraceae bacterium]
MSENIEKSAEKAFGNIFGACCDIGSRALFSSCIESMVCIKEDNALEVTVSAEKLITKEELYRAEDCIKEKLGLNSVRIWPKYPAELFGSDYLPELVTELKRSNALVNGIFEDSRCDWLNNELIIYLSHGGEMILNKISCQRRIGEIIKREFGIHAQVEFDGKLDVVSLDELTAQTPPEKRTYSADELPPFEVDDPAVKEAMKKKTETAVKVHKPKVVTPKKPLPYVESSMEVVTGKIIRDESIPLSEVTQESGRVVVWG